MWEPAKPQDTSLPQEWWKIFHESELDSLEEKLNSSNQSIAQAYQNFMAARAQVRQARAAYAPTLSTQPAYTRSRASANQSGQSIPGVNLNSNAFNFPFDVSWQPDVFGRIRNSVREFADAAQVSASDLANQRLTEQANLAIFYFELRGQDAEIDLFDRTISAYRQNLKLTQVRSKTGVDTEQSVAQAELNLNSAQATATNLGIARAQQEHAIAMLIGQPASTFSLPHRALLAAIPPIPVGVPSDLLQRRPDVAATERNMAQSNALIGVGIAAFYPNFNISGSAGLESSAINNWMAWPSRFFSIGPAAAETLLDGGQRRAVVAQYKAQYQAQVANYRQTVLSALQATEDTLASERILAIQIVQQQETVQAAARYYTLANARYRTGVDTYLNVFTAETSLLTNQDTLITLKIQQLTNSVQLIQNLGGGWNASQLPSESEVGAKR
jgi:NodT family efflux transporter outer membrane factor (OMF) lipoprotein